MGYGTHGLLDFATTYGTMLFWPFSQERYAASIVSIVDPLMTLPVLILIVLAGLRRSPLYARLALAWVVLYLSLAAWQHFTRRWETAREISPPSAAMRSSD